MNLGFIIWTACFFELVTYTLRFGFDFHSKSIQKKIHLPMRIHHMYIGLLLVVPGVTNNFTLFPDMILGGAAITLLDVALAIALSDMLHHFGILPLFHQKMDFP